MSEQIQSLLSEMEGKFEESFSQSLHDEPISKDLNPESGKKREDKLQNNNKIESREVDFDEKKGLLLDELNVCEQRKDGDELNELQSGEYREQDSHQHPKSSLTNNKRLDTPNFKQNQHQDNYNTQDMRKTVSQQQFSSSPNFTPPQNQSQNPFYYKQLTMKLERALMKISSQKVVGHTKKSHTFYDRVQQFEQKKQKEIERRKLQLQEKQISSVQDRPLINSHSRAIMSQLSSDPIHIRCEKILQKRKQKQEEYKKIKQQRAEEQYEAYKQQFDRHMEEVKQKYEGKAVRSPEEYYHEQLTWIKAREKNIESRMTQQKEKINQQVTFKPLINSKSEKIIQKRDEKRVPIFERQPKPKDQIKDPNCTFKPKINRSNFHKKLSYYQAPF